MLYRDPDDDVIMLSSGIEFDELIRLVKQDLTAVIKITLQDNVSSNSNEPRTAPPQPGNNEGAQQQQQQSQSRGDAGRSPSFGGAGQGQFEYPAFAQMLQGLMGMVTAGIAASAGASATASAAATSAGASSSSRRCNMRRTSGMGDINLGGILPFILSHFNDFNTGGDGNNDGNFEIPSFSEETKQAFHSARDAFNNASLADRKNAVRAIFACLPGVLDTISNALPSGSDSDASVDQILPGDVIDAVANSIQTSLRPQSQLSSEESPSQSPSAIPEGLASAIVSVVRVGLSDTGVTRLLRRAPLGMIRDALTRMNVNVYEVGDDDIEIDMEIPDFFTGSRGRRNQNFEIPEDQTVPTAPLMRGDQGNNVWFLQKVLTDLGYMTGDMYAMRAGFYGPRTQAAVERLQREFGLQSATAAGVYDATTAASLASIVESGDGARECHRAAGSNDQSSAAASAAAGGAQDAGRSDVSS